MKQAAQALARLVVLLLASAAPAARAQPAASDSPETTAVAYLAGQVALWRMENDCYSRHHHGDGVRALLEARRRGWSTPAEVLADVDQWLASPQRWSENKDGLEFIDQRLADLQFGAAQAAAGDGGLVLPAAAIAAGAARIAASQDADGAWRTEPGEALGSPVNYGPHLATAIARRALARVDAARYAVQIARADQWLSRQQPRQVLAAAAVLIALPAGDEGAISLRRERLQWLARAEHPKGSWGPFETSPPEPFDTAVAVLALAPLEDAGAAAMAERGRRYLIAQQQEDGSWRATTRPAGGDSYPQKISTSAWATQALLATAGGAR